MAVRKNKRSSVSLSVMRMEGTQCLRNAAGQKRLVVNQNFGLQVMKQVRMKQRNKVSNKHS